MKLHVATIRTDSRSKNSLEFEIREKIESGATMIHFVGFQYNDFESIVQKIRFEESGNVAGYQLDDDPPHYFSATCTSMPFANNE